MRKLALATLLSTPLLASAATNLLSNGSFESGLSGWSLAGSVGDIYPAVVINYNSAAAYPVAAFGESVPQDNAVNLGPDAAGEKALYFVSDFSSQTLSQTIALTSGGSFSFGFDYYLPANGFANAVNATLGVSLSTSTGSINLGTISLASSTATTWKPSSNLVALPAGAVTVTLAYTSNGYPAKDIVIDKVYLVSAVPEGSTTTMLIAGLACLGFVAARRKVQR